MRDLNDLTRPTVPSGAIQERMLAETEERRGVVGPAPAADPEIDEQLDVLRTTTDIEERKAAVEAIARGEEPA